MLFVALISGALCALAVFRHTTDRGWHGFAMPIFGIIALVSGWFWWQGRAFEQDLTEAVRTLTGNPDATVVCQGFAREFRLDNNAGEAYVDEARAELWGNVCDDIRDWMDSDKSNPSAEQIFAVHVLTHEAVHVAGVLHEGATECFALQYNIQMAQLLGATRSQAELLAQRYHDEFYIHRDGEYRSVYCQADDELDLTPGDGVWPGDAGPLIRVPNPDA